jgi:predicted transcriptional regulator
VRRWLRRYRAGASFRTIADEAGVSDATVRRALAGKVESRDPGPVARAKPTTARVVEAYERLGSIRGVEAQLGVSETYVRARLFEAGMIERHPDQRPRKTPPAGQS